MLNKNINSLFTVLQFVSATNTLRDDASINVLILKSSIPKVFCSGADLKERIAMPDNQVVAFPWLVSNPYPTRCPDLSLNFAMLSQPLPSCLFPLLQQLRVLLLEGGLSWPFVQICASQVLSPK